MKKFIIAVMSAFCVVGAYAAGENERATSVGYVTEELETRQDKFNKLGADTAMTYSGSTDGAVGSRTITGDLGAETNTSATTLPTVGGVNTKVANKQDELDFAANTVLMNTGTAGAPAAKGIYQSSGDYNTQTDSLVEAATFNAALQTAINSEFTCAERKDPNDPNSKCLLFNIFAPTQNLMIPNTYTRLEYLESTGTQYIDTGYKPNNKTVVKTKFNTTKKQSYIFGSRWSMSPIYDTFGVYISSVSIGQAQYGQAGVSAYKRFGDVLNQDIVLILDIDILTANSNKYSIHRGDIDSNPLNMYMFGDNQMGNVYERTIAKIYYLSISENGILIRNFIPAKRNSDGELGMYETVTNTFFTNAGTGTFIAGPEMSSNIYLPMN